MVERHDAASQPSTSEIHAPHTTQLQISRSYPFSYAFYAKSITNEPKDVFMSWLTRTI